MADNADIAADIANDVITIATIAARLPMPAGTSGECEECEWWMPRLVEGRCAFCRDGRPRPADWEPPTPPAKNDQEASPPALEETIIMKPKTICLPGSAPLAIEAVEARAKALGEPLGVAAADLIIAGSQTIDAERWTPPAPPTIDGLLDQLRALFADRDDAAIGEIVGRADAAEARADAAEAKVAQLRAALE